MGGTSTDISLIVGGEAAIASDRRIAGQRVALQSLDITSIGAGGGSIARVHGSGMLHVGPESAGAQPGPACYGRGGTEATVTDANLVLGFLSPDNFLGGRARLDRRAAETAVDSIAGKLGLPRMAAAEGAERPAPRVVVGLPVAVCADADVGRERAAKLFASYLNIPTYQRILARGGDDTSPSDVAIIGTEAEVVERLRSYAAAGATDLCATALGLGAN